MRNRKKGVAVALACLLAVTCIQVPAEAAKKSYARKISITNRAEVKKEMKIGDRVRIQTEVTPAGHKDKIRYSSSNKAVVVVSQKGSVRAVSEGTATVTVSAAKGKAKEKKVKVTVVTEPMTAKQTGAKTIEVTSGTDLLDQEIRVTKNGTPVEYERELSSDGKKAVLTTANSITEGTYTVSAGEESVEVAGETAVETAIEILSDRLAMDDYAGNATKATVGYRVVDQFGGDMTRKVSVQATCSIGPATADARYGTVTVEGNAFRYIQKDAKVTMMLYCMVGTKQLNVQKELVLSDRPTVSSVNVQLYSPDGKVLTDDFDGDDAFYLAFDIRDQYGNAYREVNRTNEHVFDTMNINLLGGMTDLALEGAAADGQTPAKELLKESIEIGGESYPAVRLAVAAGKRYASYGDASLNVYSYGGASANFEFRVAYGTTIDLFRVLGSDTVVQGEDVEIEYEAYDAYGEPVEKLSAYRALLEANDALKKEFKFVKEGGKVRMYHRDTSTEEPGPHYMSVLTPNTRGTSSFQYTVMAAARPTAITGLKGIETGVVGRSSIKFMVKNFRIEDQYGREMSNDDIYLSEGIYTIIPVAEDEGDFDIQGRNLIELNSSGYTNVKFNFENGSRNMNFRIAGSAGQEITDLLGYDAAGVKNTAYDKIYPNLSQYSEYTAKLMSSEVRNLNRYEVNEIGTMYYGAQLNSGYAEELTVYGISGRNRIRLSSDDYTVVVQDSYEVEENNAKGVDGLVYDDGYNQLYSAFTEGDFIDPNGEEAKELTRKLEVVVNGTGEVVSSQEIRISKEEPKVASASLKTKRGKEIRDLQLTPEQLATFSAPGGYLEELVEYIRFTDQYGASDPLTNPSKPSSITEFDMTFRMVDAETESGMIRGNGTKTPSFEGFKAGDEFGLEIRFSGGASIVTTVSVI